MHDNRSMFPEPDISDAAVAERLATRWGRLGAHMGLLFKDHHVLRLAFRNVHEAGPGMWRTNQPSPVQLKHWAEAGVKTVVNLRGMSPRGFHVLEREACDRHGMTLVTFRVNSRDAPLPQAPRLARELFDSVEYPALMHCKSGADRAGLMSVLYRHFRLDEPVATALEQLSFKYLHVRAGKTGILDAFFEHYLEDGAPLGLSLIDWAETRYDPDAFKASFKPDPVGDFLVDKVLRRE